MRSILYITYDGIDEKLAASQVLPYLKRLSRNGNSITVLSYVKERMDRDSIEKLKRGFLIENIFVLKYHKRLKLAASIFDIILGIIVGSFLIIRLKINIIHARSYVSCCIARILKVFFKIPYIFDIRGFLPEERIDSGDWKMNSLSYRLSKHVEKKLFTKSDFVITLTEKAKNIVNKDFKVIKENIEMIPTCVDFYMFGGKYKKNKKVYDFVYSGSLGTWYLLPQMMQFFKNYLLLKSDSRFLFLTDTREEEILKETERQNINNAHIDIKFVEYKYMPQFLSACKASIFFIKRCYSKIASCPTKFAESLAAGLPVITNYGIGDLDEIVESNNVGVLIKDFGKEGYIQAIEKIERMFLDKDIQNRCKKVARDYFSLEKAIDKYNTVYKQILQKHK